MLTINQKNSQQKISYRNLYTSLGISLILYSCGEAVEFTPSTPVLTKVHTGQTADYNEYRNLYFGDLHIHTGWSFDAYMGNVRVTPDEAYRFGKGESMPHVSGDDVMLNRPLDFMAVSDHAEYMGALMLMADEHHSLSNLSLAKKISNPDQSIVKKAMRKLQLSIATNWPIRELVEEKDLQYTWKKMVEIADNHYEPGTFTTFPAYEWTSSPAEYTSLIAGPRFARNLHRNVIYKGGKVSQRPFSSFDSQNPERLWDWMEHQQELGIELLAIPHNANISDGRMYARNTYKGNPFTEEYLNTRLRNEPIHEVVQIKGQSMIHPLLASNDEFADFEIYPYALGQGDPRKEVPPNGGYAREALTNGMLLEQEFGVNPFQFGVIGSSDGHNGGSNIEENNNIGKSGKQDSTPEIRMGNAKGATRHRRSSVAGLAAVWAEENTRESIFSAFQRKEVYATSGPRIRIRLFASWTQDSLILQDSSWIEKAYENGVPMGSKIGHSPIKDLSPSFIIKATKDNEGANLDRIQIIKAWVDSDQKSHEKIYDVAWSKERRLINGNLAPVGNTVDTMTAQYTNTIGSISLNTIWTDPDFDPLSHAFYYARVLEIPTPRWTTYDAVAIGVPLPKDVPYFIQERAWTSAIWYIP